MVTEKQQARHDIDVIKASMKTVQKQLDIFKENCPSYANAIEDRVLTHFKKAFIMINEIQDKPHLFENLMTFEEALQWDNMIEMYEMNLSGKDK